jgi:hypothetical protein
MRIKVTGTTSRWNKAMQMQLHGRVTLEITRNGRTEILGMPIEQAARVARQILKIVKKETR